MVTSDADGGEPGWNGRANFLFELVGLGVADEDATEINSECVSLNKYLESAGQNTFGAKDCGLWQADSIPTSVRL